MYPCRALLSECFFLCNSTSTIQQCECAGYAFPRPSGDMESHRQEKVTEQPQRVSDSDEKVSDLESKSNQAVPKSNQAEPKSNQVRLTAKQRKVLEFCDETPRTAQKILEMLGVQNQNKTRQQYTTKLVLCRTSSFPQGISLR